MNNPAELSAWSHRHRHKAANSPRRRMSEVQSDNPENETSGNWRFCLIPGPVRKLFVEPIHVHTYYVRMAPFPQTHFPRCGLNRDKQECLSVFWSLIRRLKTPYSPHWVRLRMLPGHMEFSGVVIMYKFLGCVLVFVWDLWAFWACLCMSGHSGWPVYCTEYVGRRNMTSESPGYGVHTYSGFDSHWYSTC